MAHGRIFSEERRAGLRRFVNDDGIADLERAVRTYRQKARRSRRLTAPALSDLHHIHVKATALLRTIEAAHPAVRWRVQWVWPRYRDLLELLSRREQRNDGPPVNWPRRDLEHDVAWTLHRRGIRLTEAPGGTLAQIMMTVIDVADGVELSENRIVQICRRVRHEVREKVEGIDRFNAWIDASAHRSHWSKHVSRK